MLDAPKAILETSLYVTDVERAIAFYQDVLGLRRIDDGYFAGGGMYCPSTVPPW